MDSKPKTNISIDDVREQNFIVYAYIDTTNNRVAYVGSDTNGHRNRRHIEHFAKSHRARQKCNNVLQADPSRYAYEVLAVCPNMDWMSDIEATLIAAFKADKQCWLNVKDELLVDAFEVEDE